MSKKTKKLTQAALGGLIALTAGTLAGCGDHSQPIRCTGVAKGDPSKALLMGKGECKKLAGGVISQANAQQINGYKAYPYSSYVKCYGVAASGMNDCGTNTTACGGSEKTAKAKDAWIAFPEKLCNEVGGRVEKPTKHSEWKPLNKKNTGHV